MDMHVYFGTGPGLITYPNHCPTLCWTDNHLVF